ncbi:MAG: tryptophan synthase subunit beta [Bacteroidota bacterium]
MVFVKICGLTSIQDAAAAADAGADAAGFVFAPSPRRVTPGQAAEIGSILPRRILRVGVFASPDPEEVERLMEEAGLDLVQIHGAFPAAAWERLGERAIRCAAVGRDRPDPEMIRGNPRYLLLDAFHPRLAGGTGRPFPWREAEAFKSLGLPLLLAGGLTAANVASALEAARPAGVDVSTGVEKAPGRKDPALIQAFLAAVRRWEAKEELIVLEQAERAGYFGPYGGQYVPETVMTALGELAGAYEQSRRDPGFRTELRALYRDYAGRPTPLYHARHLSAARGGAQILLKREDLNHTGAHKLNNTLGQILLARRMGKRRIVAETGAGQHGVASATVAALFGFSCTVYMGAKDVARQAPNVARMRLLGAEVRSVASGSQTLKDATSEAIRDWVTNVDHTYYLIGSVVGPHPYPLMVRDFQSIIGREALAQVRGRIGRLPAAVYACVGGGSNAMGIFHAFLDHPAVRLIGVEAAGLGLESGRHAASLSRGRPGVLHGALSYLLCDGDGQVQEAHSISAGLDYPGVGPEHSWLKDQGRVSYTAATDGEALAAFRDLAAMEGIIPALESAHALAAALRDAPSLAPEEYLLVNLSGRGDKDLGLVAEQEDQAR